MRRQPRHLIIPEPQGGYVLNPQKGWFSVIVPYQRTNLITNGSFETNTTSWTAVGGSIARSTTDQYHGAYSLAITPSGGTNSDGAFFGTVSLTSGTTYAFSLKIKATANRKYTLSIATTGGSDLTASTFVATGRWQWVWGFWTETSSTTRRLYIRKAAHDSAAVFYIDGVQIEACGSEGTFVTTYIDGDQRPLIPGQTPAPFSWNGTPHASTSTRLATTRAGGRVVNLDEYRYRVTGLLGLGMTPITNIATPQGVADGAAFQTAIARSRAITINGLFDAWSLSDMQRRQSSLYDAIGVDSVLPRQPLVIHYQGYDCLRPTSDIGRIVASYERGLEGQLTTLERETAPITFTQWLPGITADDDGVALNVQTSVANANRIIQRSAAGLWAAMGTGANSLVYAIAVGLDGKIYAGGGFTAMGGVANTSGIAYWDGSAWNAVGTGVTGGNTVTALAVGPDGVIYAGGNFTQMGGVANTTRIAKWNGSAWSALSTGADNTVWSLVFGNDGTLYAGGAFANIGGSAIANIAKWNGSAWSALSGAVSATCYALARDAGGNIYAGGAFTSIGATTTNGVAKWNGTSWSAMGTGVNTAGGETVRALAVAPNGFVYAGGTFVQIGGATATFYIGYWDGSSWQALAGVYPNLNVHALYFDASGVLWIGGEFTGVGTMLVGGLLTSTGLVRYVGGTYLNADVTLPAGVVAVYEIGGTRDGRIFVGWDGTAGTATAAGITTATNNGSHLAYPLLRVGGPSSGTARIYQLATDHGLTIYVNAVINSGETWLLYADPRNPLFVSDFQGDLTTRILTGSTPLLFALGKGDNSVSLFSAGSSVTAALSWPNTFQSLADLTI